jgi:hypothetical protein
MQSAMGCESLPTTPVFSFPSVPQTRKPRIVLRVVRRQPEVPQRLFHRHLGVDAIRLRFVATGQGHSRLGVVGHEDGGRAAEIL